MAKRERHLPNGLDSVCEIVEFQSQKDFDTQTFTSGISALDALPIEPLLEAAQDGWSAYFLGRARRKAPADPPPVSLKCMAVRMTHLQDELRIPVTAAPV